jgi:hypothetical protein
MKVRGRTEGVRRVVMDLESGVSLEGYGDRIKGCEEPVFLLFFMPSRLFGCASVK